jgi:hypothetical protein
LAATRRKHGRRWSRTRGIGRPPLRKLSRLGGKLESFYWSFGDDDFLGIIEAPDDIAAAAFSVAVGSSGSLRNLRTIKLISLDEGRKLLEKAKATKAAYTPPGAKTPAGVR